MNAWPPQPGLTVMQSTRSATPASSDTAVAGVPGLSASPARQPSSRIASSVRLVCAVASVVNRDRVGAGPGELGDVVLGTFDHQVDVDRAAGVVDLIGDRPATSGPIVIGGTKWPSITSTWMTRAPASMTSATCEPSFEKSAERIDGATRRCV